MAGPEASRRGTYSRVEESGRSKAAMSMERKQKLANEKGEKCSVQEGEGGMNAEENGVIS